jgi:hypothetical protein
VYIDDEVDKNSIKWQEMKAINIRNPGSSLIWPVLLDPLPYPASLNYIAPLKPQG